MKARIYLTSLFLILTTGQLLAQDSINRERWFEGFLVTVERDTIRGTLSYDMLNNSVKWRKGNTMQAFSSFQTFYLKIYDEDVRRWRQYYSIPYALKNQHDSPVLFELLSEGKLSLLAREHWKNTVENDQLEKAHYLRKDYFLINRAGHITYTQGRKSQLLAQMPDHQQEVKRYIREQYLDFNKESALRIAVTYYNRLVHEAENQREKELRLAATSPPTDLILGANANGFQKWIRTDL